MIGHGLPEGLVVATHAPIGFVAKCRSALMDVVRGGARHLPGAVDAALRDEADRGMGRDYDSFWDALADYP